MNVAISAFFGSVGGLGVLLIALGIRGTQRTDPLHRSRRGVVSLDRLNRRAGGAVVAALVVYLATGWIVGAVLGAFGGWASPSLIGAKARRAAALSRTEAIAAWAEQLRDTIRAAAGLQEAIATTAQVAPESIRPHVAELAVRIRREPLPAALARFAESIADPTADKIVAALSLAAERRSANLAGLLSEVATAARQQATLQLRVEAGRARTYAQTALVCSITAAVIVALVVLNRQYLDAYDSINGQLVLLGVGSLFAASGVGLVRLSRGDQPARILSPLASVDR